MTLVMTEGSQMGSPHPHKIRRGKIHAQEPPPRTLGRGGNQRLDTEVIG